MKKALIIFFVLLAGCASDSARKESPDIVSMQIVDRNGFSETISVKDRLAKYDKTDFLASQPYQKVVRVFRAGGKISSIVTSYHTNGLPWQYLEIENGRACGAYREWHFNGKIKIEASIIEGTPDISELAQVSWVFDKNSRVWDEDGKKVAEIPYEKGMLQGPARYFFPNGQLSKEIPYRKDKIEGMLTIFSDSGSILEKTVYHEGLKDGEASGYWPGGELRLHEHYEKGLLLEGSYYQKDGQPICSVKQGEGKQAIFQDGMVSSLVEIKNGIQEGEVQSFRKDGTLASRFFIKDGKKSGDEYEYFPSSKPKLCIHWNDDVIQGVVKTWYENGVMESQREMHGNKKHGLAFAWFKEGDLMLMEEYENDHLVKGSYYKKWEKKPISKVENGKGTATLYDSDGHFLKKITYDKGLPQDESAY